MRRGILIIISTIVFFYVGMKFGLFYDTQDFKNKVNNQNIEVTTQIK